MKQTRWAVRCKGENRHAEWLSQPEVDGWSPDKGARRLFDDRSDAVGQLRKWRKWIKTSHLWAGTTYHLVRIGPKPLPAPRVGMRVRYKSDSYGLVDVTLIDGLGPFRSAQTGACHAGGWITDRWGPKSTVGLGRIIIPDSYWTPEFVTVLPDEVPAPKVGMVIDWEGDRYTVADATGDGGFVVRHRGTLYRYDVSVWRDAIHRGKLRIVGQAPPTATVGLRVTVRPDWRTDAPASARAPITGRVVAIDDIGTAVVRDEQTSRYVLVPPKRWTAEYVQETRAKR
jgi:hypothetical protein